MSDLISIVSVLSGLGVLVLKAWNGDGKIGIGGGKQHDVEGDGMDKAECGDGRTGLFPNKIECGGGRTGFVPGRIKCDGGRTGSVESRIPDVICAGGFNPVR